MGRAYPVADGHILRADLDILLLLASAGVSAPARLLAAGPVLRNAKPGPLHEKAFHQLEVLVIDEQATLDPWAFMGQALRVINDLMPGRSTMIESFEFPACSAAWELSVVVDNKPVSVLAWGVYTDAIVRHLDGDPDQHSAVGIGYGLERWPLSSSAATTFASYVQPRSGRDDRVGGWKGRYRDRPVVTPRSYAGGVPGSC